MRLDRLDHLRFDKEGRLREDVDSAMGVKVVLSERNARAFVAKLDGFPKGSNARIGIETDIGMMWVMAHEGVGAPYMERTESLGEPAEVRVHVYRSNLETLLSGGGRVVRGAGQGKEALEVGVETDEVHYGGRGVGPGEMQEATEDALRRAKLRGLEPGDKVVRMLAGVVPMQMTVSVVDETFIHCGPWKFNRDLGFEVDEELGEGGSGTVRADGSVSPVMSYLVVESIEKAGVGIEEKAAGPGEGEVGL